MKRHAGFHIAILLLLTAFLGSLSGCKWNDLSELELTQEELAASSVYSPGRHEVEGETVFYVVNGVLYSIDQDLQTRPACGDMNCGHWSCSAKLDPAFNKLFVFDGFIYFIEKDYQTISRYDRHTGEREYVTKIVSPVRSAVSHGRLMAVKTPHEVILIDLSEPNEKPMLVMDDLEDTVTIESTSCDNFGPQEPYTMDTMSLEMLCGKWLIYEEFDGEMFYTRALDLMSGRKVLIRDWQVNLGWLEDDMLFCFMGEEGFSSVNLETGEVELLCEYNMHASREGTPIYDENFVYFPRSVKKVDGERQEGVEVFSHEGKPISFFAGNEYTDLLMCACSTDSRVYFSAGDYGAPAYYLEKAALEEGAAMLQRVA